MRFVHTGDFEASSGNSVGFLAPHAIREAVNDPVSICHLNTKLEFDKKSNVGAVSDKFVKC